MPACIRIARALASTIAAALLYCKSLSLNSQPCNLILKIYNHKKIKIESVKRSML